MPSDPTSTLLEKMQELRARYREQLRERLTELESIAAATGPISSEENEKLRILAHKLLGSGQTYGFTQISESARALGTALSQDANDRDLLLPALEHLIHACREAQETGFVTAPEPNPRRAPIGGTLEILSAAEAHLLLIDDDHSMHDLITNMLQDRAKIKTASSSEEAFEALAAEKPDLILLDDQLADGSSGFDILKKIQEQDAFRAIPIIMLSASDAPRKVIQGLTSGAIDYVIKPFDPWQLLEKITARLKRRQFSILIADDDETVRELLAYKFKRLGCHVLIARNGAEALEEMNRQTPDLALLDRMMPGHDGLAVLQKMRETPKLAAIPVVFLTAKHFESDILEGLNKGADDYVVKPFNPEEVVARCLRLLNQKKSSRE